MSSPSSEEESHSPESVTESQAPDIDYEQVLAAAGLVQQSEIASEPFQGVPHEHQEPEPELQNPSDHDSSSEESFQQRVDGPSVSIDLQSLSSHLNLDKEALEPIDMLVLQKFQSTISELTEIKSEKMTLEVKLESISRVNEKKETLLKKKIANLEKDNSQLSESNASLQEGKAQLQQRTNELERLQSTSSSATHSTQSKVDDLTIENRQLLEIVSKKNKEVESLRSEYSDLQESNSKLRKSVIELESSTQSAESNLIHANMKIQSLETQLDLTSKNYDWASGELEKTSEEFSAYRKDKSAEISSLQLELDQKTADYNTARLRAENLSSRFDDVSKKLDDALIQIKTLKDEKSAEEEEYLKEISVKERLVTLLQKSVDGAKSKMQHLEEQLDASRYGVASESASLQTTLDKYKDQLERSEAKIKQLEETIDEFSQTSADPNVTVSSLLPLSPSAKATAAKHSGLSLSQLYADFTLIKRQLTQERRAKERMQQQMDAFVNELEQKAPIISATKERASMLEKELTELSIVLENTTRDNDSLRKAHDEITTRLQESQVEITGLRKQRADLARQVQHLLVQVTVRNDNGGPLTPAEKKAIERIASGDVVLNDSDTDRLISERLVTFQNIIELQKKNEDLLRIVRDLGAKAEQQEQLSKSRLENLESTAISEAKEAIITLQDELKSTESKFNAVSRERDMFRSLLSGKGDNTILSGDLSGIGSVSNERISTLSKKLEESQRDVQTAHEQLEKLRVETDTTINILNKQINSLTTERSELALNLAREKSTNELTTERFNSVQDNLKYTRSEIEELRKNSQLLQTNLAKQEIKSHEAAEQLTEAKSIIESLRSESLNLKHEKQIWKSIEERLNRENASLTEEKNKLNTLLMNLQYVDKERESRNSDAQKRWTEHNESLEKELTDVRSRLSQTSSELKDVLSRKEADVKAYQDRIDSLRNELGFTREELISKKSLADSLELQVQSLATKLASTESRLNGYQNIAQSENSDSGLVSEALKLKSELDDVRSELDEANSNVAHFKNIAAAAEEALESLTESSDSYKATSTETISMLESEKKTLSEQVDILTHQLESLNNEVDEQRVASKKELMETQRELESLRVQADEASKLKADYDAKVALIESSFQQQVAVATEAQQNYEKELQKHAEASKAYASLREEANAVKERIQELTTEAKQSKDALVKSQESWNTQKTQLEDELRIVTARVNDLASQNHILYNQIETLTSRSTEAVDVESSNLDGASHELRELITLLRREKDISDTRLEVATRDLTTVRQKLSLTTSELDKTRSELLKSQSRDSDVDRVTQEYEKLKRDLEQLDLLRESNVTLRNELKTNVSKVKVLEQELILSQEKVQPLETEVVQLKAEITHKGQELKLSIEEKDRWKQRSQDILKKFDRIDPEEHKKLQESTEELKKTLNRLKEEAQEKINKSRASFKNASARLEEANKEKDTISKAFEEAKATSEALQAEIVTLKTKITELETTSKKAQKKPGKEANKENAAIETLKKELDATRTELKEKIDHLEKSKEFENKYAELESLKNTLDSRITELESTVSTLTTDLEEAQTKSKQLETQLQQANNASNAGTPAPASTPVPVTTTSVADEEQAKVIADLTSRLEKATVELEATKAELEKAKASHAAAEVPPAPAVDLAAALDEQKKELRVEFDKELADALEGWKTKIRAPSQEKLQRIAKQRTEKLEAEHANNLKELTEEYEKKLAAATSATAGKGDQGSEKVVAEYEAKIATMKKNFEATKAKELADVKASAYEEARQATTKETAMRIKLLNGKIEKLTKQLQEFKNGGSTPVAAAPVSTPASPVKLSLPAKPTLESSVAATPSSATVAISPVPAVEEASTTVDHGVKRPAEDENGPQEKKVKSEE